MRPKYKSLLRGPGLLRAVTDDQGKVIAFGRTPEGQFFFDVVMSEKSPRYLARKWNLPLGEINKLRLRGREVLKARRRRAA